MPPQKKKSFLPSLGASLRTRTPGELTVGVLQPFFPFAFRRGNRWHGFEIDILRAFCKEVGLRLRVVGYVRPTLRFRSNVKAWKQARAPCEIDVDIAVGGKSLDNGAYEVMVTASVPYLKVSRTILSRASDPVRVFPNDVSGTIAGRMGSTGFEDALGRLHEKFGERSFDMVVPEEHLKGNRFDDVSEHKSLDALRKGEIQGLMRGDVSARALAAAHPGEFVVSKSWEQDATSPELIVFLFSADSHVAPQLSAFMSMNQSAVRRMVTAKYEFGTSGRKRASRA